MIHKTFRAEVRSFDEVAQTADYLVTSDALDRDDEICEPDGMVLDNYAKSPIWMWGHDHQGPPQRCLGKALWWKRVPEGWLFRAWYDIATNPDAKIVFGLVVTGCLRAVSIGFIPIKTVWAWSSAADLDSLAPEKRAMLLAGTCNAIYTKYELLEVSNVHIGSNPEALRRALREGSGVSKGLARFLSEAIFGKSAPGVARENNATEDPAVADDTTTKTKTAEASAAAAAPAETKVAGTAEAPSHIPGFVHAKGLQDAAKGKCYYNPVHPKVADMQARLYSVACGLGSTVDPDGDGDIDSTDGLLHHMDILKAVLGDMKALCASSETAKSVGKAKSSINGSDSANDEDEEETEEGDPPDGEDPDEEDDKKKDEKARAKEDADTEKMFANEKFLAALCGKFIA